MRYGVCDAMVTLETPRLYLRPPDESDVVPMLDIHQDPEVLKFLQVPVALIELTTAWRNVAVMIGHWHMRGYGQWTVVEKSTDDVVGRVGLWNPEGWPGVELGWLIRRSRWGHGFATEAARGALHWAWLHTEAEHIISLIQPDNFASMRVAEKLGQRFERPVAVNGTNFHQYGIRRSHVKPVVGAVGQHIGAASGSPSAG